MHSAAHEKAIIATPRDNRRQESGAPRTAQPNERRPGDRNAEDVNGRVAQNQVVWRRHRRSREPDRQRRTETRAERNAAVAVEADANRNALQSEVFARKVKRWLVDANVPGSLERLRLGVELHRVGPKSDRHGFAHLTVRRARNRRFRARRSSPRWPGRALSRPSVFARLVSAPRPRL